MKFKFDFSKIKARFKNSKKTRKPWDSKRKKRAVKIILLSLLSFILLFVVAALGAFAYFSKDLPTPEKIANTKLAQSTKIYDRTGTILLYETGDEKRTIITSDQISQYLKDATVSTEDANFYNHHGVDPKAILEAVFQKMTGQTAVLRGGSTLTQQYVKLSLLSSDRSLTRKIKEVILSIELESIYSKDQILTMYLNQIPYGSATGGAEAAAKMYYGVSAKDLTLAQAATLAAIPKSPTTYSLYGTHIDKLIIRRNYVLDQMVKNGKITEQQAEEAKKVDTTTIGVAVKPHKDSILAPHFAMYVLEQVANQYGEDAVNKQGLKIITTLDYSKQQIAEQSVTDGIKKVNQYGGSNAALVAVDPKNGQILSMVGSVDYFNTAIDGNVNVADASRQPGSSFKPFAYATAFKSPDFSPSRILYDFTTDFGSNYIPQNYNGKTNGPLTMRVALVNSLNIPAVKTMALAGIDNVLKTASDMGITTLTQRDRYGLSLVLGSGEVKPVEMAGAYATFANGGIKHPTTALLKITDSSGKVLYDFDKDQAQSKQALDPQIAYEISSILSDNASRALVFGTHSALAFSDRTVAAKTGTTNDFKDAWTMGYTPSIAVAVWTGNNNAVAMKKGADGSIVAAPIFHEFIQKVLAGTPNEAFVQPPGIQTVTVEKYSNKLPTQYSKQTTTDIFAQWQVPTTGDDINKAYVVCKGTNLLAPAGMDPSLTETKVMTDLHSERPTDPAWEGPVRAWAAANGMTAAVPTGSCDAGTFAPTVTITSPQSGGTVPMSTQDIIATATSSYIISQIEFFLDNVSIGAVTTSPYTMSYNFANATSGAHTLSAVVTDEHGVTARTDIPISIESTLPVITPSAPKQVSSLPLNYSISWTTDRPTTGDITYHPENGLTTTISTPTNASSQTITLPNLLHNTKYYYTINVADASQNSASYSGTFTTPLN